MEKNYEKYAMQVKELNKMFSNSVKRIADELNEKLTDWRLSEKGREEQRQKKIEELNIVCENMNNVFREAVKHFLTDYAIGLPDDGIDHSKDIENALRVVDMLGFDLDVKNFDNIMTPLRGNYRAMKTVIDVMQVKNDTGLAGMIPNERRYSNAIMEKIIEYTGITNRVSDFLEIMDNIADVVDNPVGYRYIINRLSITSMVEMSDVIPYNYLSCGDWMIEAGEMYAYLENEFVSLFKKHTPTYRELIESSLPGHLGYASYASPVTKKKESEESTDDTSGNN